MGQICLACFVLYIDDGQQPHCDGCCAFMMLHAQHQVTVGLMRPCSLYSSIYGLFMSNSLFDIVVAFVRVDVVLHCWYLSVYPDGSDGFIDGCLLFCQWMVNSFREAVAQYVKLANSGERRFRVSLKP